MSSRATGVSLRPVTTDNQAAVEAVRVTPTQERYVAGVAASLVEAVEHPAAKPWHRAVYRGADVVGFVMISDGIEPGHPEYVGPFYLWRLLVDTSCQGEGIGAAIIDLVVDYLRSRPGATELLTSVVPGPDSPIGFYEHYGFVRTGAVEDGEDVLSLALP